MASPERPRSLGRCTPERRHSARGRSAGLGAAALAALALASPVPALAVPALAAPAEAITIPGRAELERDPLAAAELLMELSEKAEYAEASQQREAAVTYYLGIARLVPDRALAFSKLCRLYRELAQPELALQACRQATTLPGVTLPDYLSYASLLLEPVPERALGEAEVAELDALFAHLAAQGAGNAEAGFLQCRLGVKLESAERLRQCLGQLEQALPDAGATLPYRFSLALLERDFARGRELIERARESGLGPDVIDLMQRELDARDRHTRVSSTLAGSLALGLGVVALALGRLLRHRRRTSTRATVS
jgi:tetratricopeptide (TPR) repeat protein